MVTDYLPLLAQGAGLSLCVMLLSLAVALILGLINAVIKLFGPRWLRWISTGYTTLVRGIPELVIMLLLFFGGEMLVNGFLSLLGLGPVRFNTFVSGVLAFGIVFGAWLLGEPIEPSFLLGAVPVMVGIVLVSGGGWVTQWAGRFKTS